MGPRALSKLFLASLLLPVLGVGLSAFPANSATHDVSVQGVTPGPFVFVPADLNIQAGDVVRWNWVSGMHTTTSGVGGVPDGIWNAPIDNLNTTFQRTFNNPGSFPYYCAFHFGVGMTGTITVSGGGGNVAPVVTNPGTQNGVEDAFFSVNVFATDANGDALTMADLGTTPAWATFTDNGNNTATISGTPALGDAGVYSQSVRADDGSLADTEIFDIVIDPAPIVPVELSSGFVPDSVSIPVGHSVRWIKNTGGQHTTTSGSGGAPDGTWDSPLNNQIPTFERLFSTPGTFPYFCSNHPGTETGVVEVNDTTQVGIGDARPEPSRLFRIPYPNPFTQSVSLAFNLERAALVRIDMFDLSGRRVRDFLVGTYSPGLHELKWGGRDDTGRILANGVYFVRFRAEGRTVVQKVYKSR